MRTHLPAVASLVVAFALSAAGVVVAASAPPTGGVLFALGALLAIGAESWVARQPQLFLALERFQIGHAVRSGLRGLLLVGLVAPWASQERDLFQLVALVVAVVWLSRVAMTVLLADSRARRDYPITWRNLDVPGVVRHAPLAPGLLTHGGYWSSVAGNVLVAGVVAHLAGADATVTRLSGALAMAAALLLVVVAAIDNRRARKDTPAGESAQLVAGALRERTPEVLFYYSRPEAIGYIANVWMPTLEKLDRSIVVLVREPHNAPLVETDTLPVVMVAAMTDIEVVVPESVRIALYPSNVNTNNHLLRLPGIVDVFVGHGDSDKGGSATVLTRIFDEAWVSGPAARDRYRVADVGVRDEQIREIGRPQLAEIEQSVDGTGGNHRDEDPAASWEYTVLYAPTREGFFAEWEYSSVLNQGAVILRTLMDLPGVRVLFKPHPGTGTDDPAFAAEVERLEHLVLSAGAPHELVTGAEGLYSAFNRADLLVSDISSVITDFLASGKPYVVTDPGHGNVKAFQREYPSAGGAYILQGDGSGVAEFVHDARTSDSLAAERAATAHYLLGSDPRDPVERFNEAVSAAVASRHGWPPDEDPTSRAG